MSAEMRAAGAAVQAAGAAVQAAGASLIRIYTDGACKGNPGKGGWGAYLVYQQHERALHGGEPLTTNNRMELMAVIQGLRALKRASRVEIHTDSSYVQQGMSQWIHKWKRQGWLTADRKPVKNVDLWRELDRLAGAHQVSWHWVKGHAGHPGNERADQLANLGVIDQQGSNAAAAAAVIGVGGGAGSARLPEVAGGSGNAEAAKVAGRIDGAKPGAF